jgi:hypothetical protein
MHNKLIMAQHDRLIRAGFTDQTAASDEIYCPNHKAAQEPEK